MKTENEVRTFFLFFFFSFFFFFFFSFLLFTFENDLNLFWFCHFFFGGGVRKRGANFTSSPARQKCTVRHWESDHTNNWQGKRRVSQQKQKRELINKGKRRILDYSDIIAVHRPTYADASLSCGYPRFAHIYSQVQGCCVRLA